MCPHKTARSTWTSTAWLLMLLCLSLLAWRLDTRVSQYRPVGASRSATVNFFDANESNVASNDQAGNPARSHSGTRDRLFRAVCVEPPAGLVRRYEVDSSHPFPALAVQPVSLFSNPPPSLLA